MLMRDLPVSRQTIQLWWRNGRNRTAFHGCPGEYCSSQ